LHSEHPNTEGVVLVRLARVVYWLCCLLAAIIAAMGVAAWYDRFQFAPNGQAVMLVFAAAVAIVWAIGRAFRYVVSNE